MSPSSDAAVKHLRNIKPNDGWSIEHKTGSTRLVRLTRRNIPVTDSYFFDIHYDSASDRVVGILTGIGKDDGKVQAQVLVGSNGNPRGQKMDLVSVSTYKNSTAASSQARASTTRSYTTNNTNTNTNTALTDAQNRDLIMYGASAIVAAILFRLVFNAMFAMYILAFPLLYMYLVSTCPSMDSFDAKKELKRILRGYHLPDDHPEKPRGMLSETLARIQATVTTELATLPGYEVTTIPLAGAAVVACTRVPSVNMDYYWVGACNKWWYVYGCELKNDGSVN